ncbi:MAG: hypothetical protein KAS32_13300 [Candidatus Peribacteraceae bacterium]|nr:hypothetical protein [Candidatus Peribacteraceae bacterium]
MAILAGIVPLLAFIAGMLVNYRLNFKSMEATMRLAYKIRENMPYEAFDEIEQTETE